MIIAVYERWRRRGGCGVRRDVTTYRRPASVVFFDDAWPRTVTSIDDDADSVLSVRLSVVGINEYVLAKHRPGPARPVSVDI